jgi:hypothetical protein
MRLTVFTAVIGDTDMLRPPRAIASGVRYVCFTDHPSVRQRPYEIVRVEAPNGPRLCSREVKILANHPALGSPDVTLWHDAAYELRCDVVAVATDCLNGHDLVAFKHPHRTQIEDEAIAIAKHGYVPLPIMQTQAAQYRAEGFVQTAITSTGFCLRRRTPQVEAFNALWWAEVARWGWRDQMSVDYALWRCGLTAHYIRGHYRDNPYARWYAEPARKPAWARPA